MSAQYPEHEKLKTVAHISQAQGDFIEWLRNKGLVLCSCDVVGAGRCAYFPAVKPITTLLAEFHEINLRKLDDEKRAMVEELRK